MTHPSGWNLHDWAEVYFEGPGWVPVDVDFGIPPFCGRTSPTTGPWSRNDPSLNLPGCEYFFLGGVDSYRMVVSNGICGPLQPRKEHFRSETVDFQRGEAEWKGGNLYFNDWNWSLEILSSAKED